MSVSPRPRVPVEALRNAVQRAVDATSLRAVAGSIGMSEPWVRKFLNGADPHAATARKLAEWYVKDAAETQALDAETAAAALTLLVDPFPVKERNRVRKRLTDVLREGYERMGTDPPPWLADG